MTRSGGPKPSRTACHSLSVTSGLGGGRSFGSPCSAPPSTQLTMVLIWSIGQRHVVLEVLHPDALVDMPWRHLARRDALLDGPGPGASVLEGDERHRRDRIRLMTFLAFRLKDWCDVLGERHLPGRCVRGPGRCAEREHGSERRRSSLHTAPPPRAAITHGCLPNRAHSTAPAVPGSHQFQRLTPTAAACPARCAGPVMLPRRPADFVSRLSALERYHGGQACGQKKASVSRLPARPRPLRSLLHGTFFRRRKRSPRRDRIQRPGQVRVRVRYGDTNHAAHGRVISSRTDND